ncbi:ankyrin repeat-containing domain protein [Russula earlei]|uniref:Ankyrin repeat-containing domain protein n=1 Tax=Russula earlei TaxID=71964 RepID=A0ACC0UBW8_9AGAM|nr:ankyrin repeat-containing domain protein [Russula earlei]
MEYFFDADKPHLAAWRRVYDIDPSPTAWDLYFSSRLTAVNPIAAPLNYAVVCGFYDVIEHLIVKNPEHVHARGGRLVTPLVAALRDEDFKIAELLYRHDANVDVRGVHNLTPLHVACRGYVDVVLWLLNHGADVNAQTFDGWVALFFAASHGQLEICRILQAHHADIGSRNAWGEIPLHIAASPANGQNQLEIMQLLLDQGADANARDNDGCTPLHSSSFWEKDGMESFYGTAEGSRLLLEHGADINAENNEGETPLQLAMKNGRHEMAEFLSGMGAR